MKKQAIHKKLVARHEGHEQEYEEGHEGHEEGTSRGHEDHEEGSRTSQWTWTATDVTASLDSLASLADSLCDYRELRI